MGQRANLVVVRNRDWSLYYDHWCANRLDVELFWGPALATAFVEALEPLADPDDWLDEVWCEGGAVIDHDRQVLLWFGGENIRCDVGLRQAYMPLLRRQWPGWTVQWATGGVADLGAYLGFPTAKFLGQGGPDPSERFRQISDHPDWNETLLTVRQDGRTAATRISGDEESIELGPSQLPALLAFANVPSLEWTGEMAMGGLHLDVDERALFFWHALPVAAFAERMSRAWPGWRCAWLGDEYEEHLRLAAGAVHFPARDPAALQQQILRHVKHLCNLSASNPAVEVGRRVGAEEINPWTQETRGSVGSELDKLRILAELERQIPLA